MNNLQMRLLQYLVRMQAKGYVMLCNLPGQNRFKNLKYYLGRGGNVIGKDKRCQIVVPEKYVNLDFMANVDVGYNFILLEALQPNFVYVESNLTRDANVDNYFSLELTQKYVIKLGEYFYLGRIKAMIVYPSFEDLMAIKGVVNADNFATGSKKDKIHSQKFESKHNFQKSSQKQKINKQLQIISTIPDEPHFYHLDQIDTNSQNRQKQMPFCEQLKREGQSKIFHQQRDKQQQINQRSLGINNDENDQSQIESIRSSHTELLVENDRMEPTIVIDDRMIGNEPTINLSQDCPFPMTQKKQSPEGKIGQDKIAVDQQRNLSISQEHLLSEIRNNEARRQQQIIADEQIDFSMPDTIVDGNNDNLAENKPEIKQEASKQDQNNQQDDDDFDMPPTIQEGVDASIEKKIAENIPKIKPSKTMKQAPQLTQIQRMYKSQKFMKDDTIKKQIKQEVKPIEDFMDLFGVSSDAHHFFSSDHQEIKQQPKAEVGKGQDVYESGVQSGRSRAANIFLKESSTLIATNSLKASVNNSLSNKDNDLKQQQQEEEYVPLNKLKKQSDKAALRFVNIVGFKATVSHRKFLIEQGYQIVQNPHNDYDVLIVKQPVRLTNKILLALIKGKQIQSEAWIFNKQSKIQSKINGMPWKAIYENKSKHANLLKQRGRFYVSKKLLQLLQGVVEELGGDLVQELEDKRRVLNVILKVEESHDTELYLKNKDNKKWRFLKSDVLVDAVLKAQFNLDQKYFINIF